MVGLFIPYVIPEFKVILSNPIDIKTLAQACIIHGWNNIRFNESLPPVPLTEDTRICGFETTRQGLVFSTITDLTAGGGEPGGSGLVTLTAINAHLAIMENRSLALEGPCLWHCRRAVWSSQDLLDDKTVVSTFLHGLLTLTAEVRQGWLDPGGGESWWSISEISTGL